MPLYILANYQSPMGLVEAPKGITSLHWHNALKEFERFRRSQYEKISREFIVIHGKSPDVDVDTPREVFIAARSKLNQWNNSHADFVDSRVKEIDLVKFVCPLLGASPVRDKVTVLELDMEQIQDEISSEQFENPDDEDDEEEDDDEEEEEEENDPLTLYNPSSYDPFLNHQTQPLN